MLRIAAACWAAAALSLLLPAAPSYDAWSWLLWGREAVRLDLSTTAGPAFKPLPVAVTALLSPAGGLAPELWLVVARAGAAAALVLAFLVTRDLAGGRAVAGVAAAAGVALTGGFLLRAATGDSEPLLLALALAALWRAKEGRHGQALALGAAAGLVRVEAWPFLAAYAGWCAWRHPWSRAPVAAGALAVPAAWLLPEWLGSGEILRSGDRALVPNPGAPALADVPVLESLRRAAGLVFVPVALGIAAVRTRLSLVPAAAGAAWMLLVGLMAEAGFSGEERYALPGAALLAISGGAGLAAVASRLPRPAALGLAGLLAAAGAARAVDVARQVAPVASGAELARTLEDAVARAGGRDGLLACGRPAVGRYRGPMLAYVLDVHKRRVRADGGPAAVTFRSSLRGKPLSPPARPGAAELARNARWIVLARCGGPSPGRGPPRAAGRRPR